MLQQTQVATVIPYYRRFLKPFPTLSALARADEQEVLRLWEGLGYYRRARDLCRAARLLRENNFTTIPDDLELVRALPGFGRYTTNAVLSQAYDRRLPILEANSRRVLCRLFAVEGDPREKAVEARLWQLAEDLLPRKGAGDFNQSLMELGALVCTPAKPNCLACPLQGPCQAFGQKRQHELPRRTEAKKIVDVTEVGVIVRKRDQVLLVQRPDGGRWAGLWEFPHVEVEAGETHEAAASRLLASLGIDGNVGIALTTIRHSVTRFRITMTCLPVAFQRGKAKRSAQSAIAWVRIDGLRDYPLSTPQRQLARLLQEGTARTIRGIRKR